MAREATTLDLQRTLETAVDRFRSLTTSDSTAIYLYDPGTNELWPAAVSFNETLYPADYVARIGRVPMGQGIVGWVAEHREPIVNDDVGKDPRGKALPGIPRENKSGICVPMVAEGQLRGVIRTNKMGIAQYTKEHLRLAQTIASQAALALTAVQAHEEARRLAITDHLTGCFNARYLTERLGQEVERSRRHGRSLALLIVDSDSLKAVNDECGHACGDRLLAELAATIHAQVRSTDIVARYGGDEFVVLAPETDLAAARITAERIRQTVCTAKFETAPGKWRTATVSVGVAALGADDDAGALFGRADRALYDAKRAGKDRVAELAA
jgi:diguanylate cyclase (GGDEF)-like protein